MSSILPAGYMPRAALKLLRSYAAGDHGEYDTAKMLQAVVEKNEREAYEEFNRQLGEDYGWTLLRTLIGAGGGAITAGGAGFFLTALFSTDRLCNILLVNATSVPLQIDNTLQVHGETRGSPLFIGELPRVSFVPAATDVAVGFGLWSFGKSFFMGMGTVGTMGVLDCTADPHVLTKGFRIGWQVPQSDHTSCGLAFDTTSPARAWFDKHVEKKEVFNKQISVSNSERELLASCANSTVNGNASLLVVTLEEQQLDQPSA